MNKFKDWLIEGFNPNFAKKAEAPDEPKKPETILTKPDAELEDFSLLPFSEKVKMVIDMMKEYGFANFEYKTEDDGTNKVIVFGKVRDSLKKNLEALAKELELEIKVDEEKASESKLLTKINIRNKMNFKKFKNVIALQKKKVKDKENILLGANAGALAKP